jgi:glycosyltransferase involved in cell wall biosynthesis
MMFAFRHGKVDVVLGTTPPIFQLPATWIVSIFRRAPFVLEVLDLWPEFAIGMGVLKNRLIIWMARKVEWFFYRRGRQLVGNSPAYRDYLIEGGIPEDRVTFIPMGVDLSLFDPESRGDKMRERFGLGDKFVVTYAGAHGISNDLDTILDAATLTKDDPEIHYLFVGGGNEKPRLEAKAKELNLTNVTFGGTVPKDEVGDVLAASNACCALLKDIPQYKTPFPNKVFDYMAAGRPVLLGIDGVIREVVEAAEAGIFFHPGKGAELADAVRRMKNNPQLVRSMKESGREYVRQHYDIALQADRFEEVFEKAIRRRSLRRS